MDDSAGRSLPSSAVVHQIRALTAELGLLVGRFARDNHLHTTDVRALIALLDAERAGLVAGPGWVADELGLDSSSVTALIDRMVRAGHVLREADPRDRRRVALRVTPAAVVLGQQFFGPLIEGIEAEMATFSAIDQAAISRFLTRMTELTRPTGSDRPPLRDPCRPDSPATSCVEIGDLTIRSARRG